MHHAFGRHFFLYGRPIERPQNPLKLAVMALVFIWLCLPLHAQSRVDSLLAEMTLEEKVGQMFMVDLYGATLNEPGRLLLEEWKPGAAVLFASNVGTPAETTRLINEWQSAVVDAGGLPMFITTDQEGGVIARLKDGFTTLPAMMLLTATGDVSLAQRTGETLARELSAVGVNMNLGPVADLYTNLNNPIIGRRSFGSEPERTGQMLAGLVRGMQGGGVLATAKHFPGHGDTQHDSHTSLPIVAHSREELDRIELAPFKWTVAAGVEAVMVAHIWYPAYDPDEQMPASLSYNVVTGVLRQELGFTGLIMTDAIEMDAIDLTFTYPEASIRAVLAGVDIIAFGANLSPQSQIAAMSGVVQAVRDGRITEARIDESVRRILDAKARYGILDWQPLDPATADRRVNIGEGSALVRELFNAGVTIAYDQIGAVPVNPVTQRVSVIYPASRPAIRSECEVYSPSVTWLGVGESPSADDIARASTTARTSDVAVVFTSNAAFDTAQQALVNALPPEKTVAVALFSPFDWQAFPGVAAYLTTYSPLPEAVPAACAVLFGAIPAQGSLPVALDGARDFANGGAQLTDGGALSLLPRRATQTDQSAAPDSTQVAMLFTPPVSQTPLPTQAPPTPTPTPPPLDSATRVPVTAAASATPTAQATVIAAILPPTSSQTTETPPPVGGLDFGTVALFGVLAGGMGLVFIGLRSRKPIPTRSGAAPQPALQRPPVKAKSAQPKTPKPQPVARPVTKTPVAAQPVARPAEKMPVAPPQPAPQPVIETPIMPTPPLASAFFLSRCVVCGEAALKVESARGLVHCTACFSMMRSQRGKKWLLRVNAERYPDLYARYHDKLMSEAELRQLLG